MSTTAFSGIDGGVVVTIFGDLQWGDAGALQEFIENHNQDHVLLAAAMAVAGIPLYAPDFSYKPDDRWFGDHFLLHREMNAALQLASSPGLSKNWEGPADFNVWHNINNNDHQAFHQALGV